MLMTCIGFRAPAAQFDCSIRDLGFSGAPAVRFDL